MFEWSEEQLMIRDAVRQFVEAEIVPKRDELEHGDLPPYDILRKLFATFGMDVMAREQFKRRIERERPASRRRRRRRGRRRAGRDGADRQRGDVDDPDHRAVPPLPGHGHGDGRVDGAHRPPRS